jgi:hypothetical protein
MKTKKEIVIEIERVRVICQRTGRSVAWCEECEAEREFATPTEASALIGQTLEQIAELVTTGVLHVGFTHTSKFLVCLDSLFQIGGNSADFNLLQ